MGTKGIDSTRPPGETARRELRQELEREGVHVEPSTARPTQADWLPRPERKPPPGSTAFETKAPGQGNQLAGKLSVEAPVRGSVAFSAQQARPSAVGATLDWGRLDWESVAEHLVGKTPGASVDQRMTVDALRAVHEVVQQLKSSSAPRPVRGLQAEQVLWKLDEAYRAGREEGKPASWRLGRADVERLTGLPPRPPVSAAPARTETPPPLPARQVAFVRPEPAPVVRPELSAAQHAKLASYGVTPRELQVLEGVVAERSNSEIAQRTGIAERTVKFHVANLMAKFGVSGRIELGRQARVELPDPAATAEVRAKVLRSLPAPASQGVELTRREREVLAGIEAGMSNKELADHLHLSVSAVKFHTAALLEKHGKKNRFELAELAPQPPIVASPSTPLTPREHEVLALFGNGIPSNKEIAQKLGFDERTAKFHVSRLLEKFRGAGVDSRALLARLRLPEG